MTRIARQVDQSASDLSSRVAAEIVTYLIYHTPVDTSKALSNWQISLGGPNGRKLEAYIPGFKGSTQSNSAAEALTTALRVLALKTPGQSIWISNNLPYIRKLDEGSSNQAPAGFTAAALLIGRNIARTQGLKLNV